MPKNSLFYPYEDPEQPKKTRRSEPINKRTARNGNVTYTFQVDVGTKPDGTRDRQRFTYRTLTEARREYRRITSEVAAGRYVKITDATVDEACEQWLNGRRGLRRNSMRTYHNDLKPARRQLGGLKLANLTKKDGDDLVTWMLSEGRRSRRNFRPNSLLSQVADLIAQHPEGITAQEIRAAFPGKPAHATTWALVKAGRATRLRRGVYAPAHPAETVGGVKPVTVRSTLTALSMVVQSYVDQGALPRNVISLVERPSDDLTDDDNELNTKSWNIAEINTFREFVADHRLAACWIMSTYGLRRSEVLGMRWTRFDDTSMQIRRARTTLGKETEENLPKSRRSKRDLPPPADLAAALRALKLRQQAECRELGIPWSDDRLIAVHEDGTPIPPDWYSLEFQRLRSRAGLRRIPLKGLRNTSVSLMLASGVPVHIVAAWHGHDPSISLSTYSAAQPEDLEAAAATLFDQGSDPAHRS
ncbi:tyrosine-type recombinase/integrase [Nocardia stercoris]|uniref:Site-specific integrase n=1 Tax=Nocardia stercoris TaxID=2483361 RepID=A0A3M2L0H0_9NOCA|nr:tyrosine-type recombinase/integrase [Nocardia stercoris]RMI28038.1 site-specific integrase [Nocardia stercoris]